MGPGLDNIEGLSKSKWPFWQETGEARGKGKREILRNMDRTKFPVYESFKKKNLKRKKTVEVNLKIF